MKTAIYQNRSSTKEHFLKNIQTHIESHLDDTNYRIATLAMDMNLSRQQLYRKTKQWTGISISSYVRTIRLQYGKTLLETTNHTVSDIAYQVGFSDPSYFSKTFSTEFGYAPSENRNGLK